MAIESAIERVAGFDASDSADDEAYAMECKTIRFGLPRGSGHTTSILSIVEEMEWNMLYIAPNMDAALAVETMCGRVRETIPWKPKSITRPRHRFVSINEHMWSNFDPDIVVVDPAYLVPDKTIESLYRIFGKKAVSSKSFMFILLG